MHDPIKNNPTIVIPSKTRNLDLRLLRDAIPRNDSVKKKQFIRKTTNGKI